MKTLSNSQLTIKVSAHGAELCSIVSNATEKEYLWQADPAFWKRHSPVLFPIVGGVWNNEYRHNGVTYPLSQHGFARDNDFELIKETSTEVLYRFSDDEETRKVYPFPFKLEIGYRLTNNQVKVLWSVKNTGTEDLPFQIGAHPAFYYPDFNPAVQGRGFFSFDKTDDLYYILIKEKGCVASDKYPLPLMKGLLPIDTHTFDKDALIFEDSQIKKVTLLDKNRQPYLSLHCTAPVLGLWSPPTQNAPFICVEPWYGRCDKADYTGEFEDKEWMQHLVSGETFNAEYIIEIENI